MRDLGSDAARTTGAARDGRADGGRDQGVRRQGSVSTRSGLDDAERIDRLGALESLDVRDQRRSPRRLRTSWCHSAAAAADRGVPPERRDRGLADQVALARRVSPHRGLRDVALALALRTDLPHTRAAFRSGRIDAFKASLVGRETASLSAEHRAGVVDERLWEPTPTRAPRLSPRRLVGRLQKAAAGLDPASVVRRRAVARRPTGT